MRTSLLLIRIIIYFSVIFSVYVFWGSSSSIYCFSWNTINLLHKVSREIPYILTYAKNQKKQPKLLLWLLILYWVRILYFDVFYSRHERLEQTHSVPFLYNVALNELLFFDLFLSKRRRTQRIC